MDRDSLGRYVKGRLETLEEKIIRSKSLKEAWLNREDYIGNLIKEHPYIYNVWRGIRFTDKGKSAGCSEDWKDFKLFYNDVVSTYEKGKVFRRKDTTKEHSKDNFIWVSKEDLKLLNLDSAVLIKYLDKELTIKEWAALLLCSAGAIKNRYFKHKDSYTVEEILFGKKINRSSKIPKDFKVSNMSLRLKASKMISSYKIRDKKMGLEICDLDIDWIIDNIITKPCTYCGDSERVGCDRIDNNIGHLKTNVVPCCYECNCARNSNFTYE